MTARQSLVPRLAYVPAVAGIALLTLPLAALLVRVDPGTLVAAITAPAGRDALRLSLVSALLATLLAVVVGVPLALVIARSGARIGGWLRALVTVPMVLPPLVGGVALLFLLGRNGLLGRYLDLWFGLRIPYSLAAVVIAQTFVAMPFLVISLDGALRTLGTDYDTVAATLGAGRWTILRRVTVPLVLPGLSAGTLLCFARALGEFGATALFAGDAPGVTRTMPLAIYGAFNGIGGGQDTAVALSVLLLAVAVVLLLGVRRWASGPAT